MIQELMPVVLIFNNVAPNSNINFTFTTLGASWSLGALSGDSMGFTVAAQNASGQPQSCIQKIEFNEGMLAIRTSSDNSSLGAFTMTLFLRVTPGVDYLQGYCTLNNDATVMAFFGAQRGMEWRNGRISAVLRNPESNTRGVLVTVQGAAPGNRISLELSTKKGLGLATWSLGPIFSEAGGIRMASAKGSVPLASLTYNSRQIVFETAKNTSSAETLDFFLLAYIIWEPIDLPYIYLKTTCDSNVSLYAHVGNRQPQLVSQTDTVFTL
ncbi:hypothetical protein [Collimonas silvisoli]|uniref:hypothetical protein n=1 Tax=Collimonas silvisoli TaxID=2825884 RepID=UPI001B8CB8F5|nr:hypothetical protein [Collimonas silvisoli]